MTSSRSRLFGVIAAAAIAVGACSSTAATPAPTPVVTPPPATETPAAPTAMASTAPTTAPLPTVPANELIKAGTLTVCTDTSYPPQESLNSSNQAVGSDIDLVTEIAKRLGLTMVDKTTVFDTIIPALTGGSCDIIVSAQTITKERLQQVDMIPYFAAGQSFVVLTGNPANINSIDDLCGKTVAAEKGTIEADHVAGTGSGYDNTNSLDANCKTKGKPNITLKVYDADTSALLALQSNTVQAHFTDEPVAGYEVEQGGGKFQLQTSMTLEHAPEGISVTKNHPELRDAIKAALLSMIADGTYTQILTKWGVQSGGIAAADVNATPAP